MILVTGATGQIGSELLARLSGRGQSARAFVRSRARSEAIALPGVELVEGDFSKPETFVRALAGVERLFLLIPSSAQVEDQQRKLVDAAIRANVKHIVKLSQLGADPNAPGRFQRYHGVIENYIRKSGIAFTFLRPNLFMQGLLSFRPMISSQGAFYASAGSARVSVVDVRDIAAVASKTLTEPGHEGKAYDITGPEALTHAEMAEQLSRALGKQIRYVDAPAEIIRQALLAAGLPEWQLEGIVEDYQHYRRGEAAAISGAVVDLTGNPPINFAQFVRDYAARFLETTG